MEIQRELAFSQEEYDARLARVKAQMAAEEIEVLLVHTPANQCYLTGFQTLNLYDYSCLVIPIDGARLRAGAGNGGRQRPLDIAD